MLLACPDPQLGHSEQKRLSKLYGPTQISVSVVKPANVGSLESLLVRALDTHGGVTCILNSTADDKLPINRLELTGSLEDVEIYLNLKQQKHDVESINRISRLAVKYLGKHNGFSGGKLLNLTSSTELLHSCQPPSQSQLSPSSYQESSSCTVLGTTRALGLSKNFDRHGVKMCTVYQPNIDYPDLSPASQITDDEHTPYYTWNRYSAYCREYTGYMALHAADTASSGTAWRYNVDMRLEQVQPDMITSSCKIANKMCYWLGCPHVPQLPEEEIHAAGALGAAPGGLGAASGEMGAAQGELGAAGEAVIGLEECQDN